MPTKNTILELTYKKAKKLVLTHLTKIEKGKLEEFCSTHDINYGTIKNFKSDTFNAYPKILLKLLTIFNYKASLITQYLFLIDSPKNPLKTNDNKTRPSKSRNRPLKKRS